MISSPAIQTVERFPKSRSRTITLVRTLAQASRQMRAIPWEALACPGKVEEPKSDQASFGENSLMVCEICVRGAACANCVLGDRATVTSLAALAGRGKVEGRGRKVTKPSVPEKWCATATTDWEIRLLGCVVCARVAGASSAKCVLDCDGHVFRRACQICKVEGSKSDQCQFWRKFDLWFA